jgi:hypothetical protein
MDDKQEQEDLERVEALIIRIFGGEHRPPPAMLSPGEERRRMVFTIVNILLTAPDAPRHLLLTRDARIRHLSTRLKLELDDAELLHDRFEICARMQPRDYPDIAMLLETTKRKIAEGNVETSGSIAVPGSKVRH